MVKSRLDIPILLSQFDIFSFFSRKWLSHTIVLLLSITLLWSCATDNKKPNPVSTKIAPVRTAIARLADSYEKKNKEVFFSFLDPSSESLRFLKNRVVQDFEHFSKVDISITIDRVEISEVSLKTTVRWRGVWTEGPNLPPLEKRGNAIFQWAATDDPKLVEIHGESPFGIYRNSN